jgi:hypothetical protein
VKTHPHDILKAAATYRLCSINAELGRACTFVHQCGEWDAATTLEDLSNQLTAYCKEYGFIWEDAVVESPHEYGVRE